MRLMFDRLNDPVYLQACLEAFITYWHSWRKPWYGIAAEKIAQTQLPAPLAWLYGFAGAWHGHHYWDTLLGNQDCLLPFEGLTLQDDKLIFVCENQGVWQVATEPTGDDPPVWTAIDGGPWQLLDTSLTRFLVTFVLHETVFGCQHLGSSENVIDEFKAAGLHVVPLWLNHPYPAGIRDHASRPLTFHVVNSQYLVMNNHYCATNVPSPWITFPALFKAKEEQPSSEGFNLYAPLPDHLQVPQFVKRLHLEKVIRRHESEIEYHQRRCDLYRQMLDDMPNDKAE